MMSIRGRNASETTKDSIDKLRMRNVLLVSFAFGIDFFGTNAFMNFAVPILGNLGSICMSIVCFVNTFSNFLVPTFISWLGTPERALLWCISWYMIYVGHFCYIWTPLQYVVCTIHGFCSAITFASQGVVLGNNSTDEDRGRNSGIFISIYMLGSALGSFAAGYIVKIFNVTSDYHDGWNGGNSIFFLVLGGVAGLSTIPVAFIRHYDPNENDSQKNLLEAEQDGKDLEAASGAEAAAITTNSMTNSMTNGAANGAKKILEDIKKVLFCAVSPRMVLLLCILFYLGYQQVFVMSQFTRQILDLKAVGSMMGVYSIVDVIFSFVFGWLSDRYGHVFVVTTAVVAGLAGMGVSWLANQEQNWLIYATGVVLAISDAGLQTECLSTVNQYFSHDRTNANSVFRMMQSFGFAVALVIMPFFVSPGEHHSSPSQYFIELVIVGIICICAYIGFLVFIYKEKKNSF